MTVLVRDSECAFNLAGTPWRQVILHERRSVWCLVDAVDYEWIIQHNWNVSWHAKTPWKYYAKRNVGPLRLTIYMHREILMRADPRDADFYAAHHGDHDNGQSLDNRRANLGWLTPLDNRRNARARHTIPTLEAIVAKLLRGAASGSDDEAPF